MDKVFEFNKKCAIFLGWEEMTTEDKIKWCGCKTIERLNRLTPEYIPILKKGDDVIFTDFSIMDFSNEIHLLFEVIEKVEDLVLNNNKYEFVLGKNYISINETNKYTNITNPISINGSKIIIGIDRKDCMIKAINFFLERFCK